MLYLAEIRKQGHTISELEHEEGIIAVAASIPGAEGKPIAAITVAGPAYRR